MDVNEVRALLTLIMFVVFVAIVIWAYSARNHERFAQAARLPLDDDCDIDERAVHGKVSRP